MGIAGASATELIPWLGRNLAEVVERHVDTVPLNQLARIVDFLEEDNAINQGDLAFHGYVNDLSPLRLKLVRRLMREIDFTEPDYTCQNS